MTTAPTRLAPTVDATAVRHALADRLWRLVCEADALEPQKPGEDARQAGFFSFTARRHPDVTSLVHHRWLRDMRGALTMIDAAESLRRAEMATRRGALPRLTPVASYEAHVRGRAVEMRDEALRETKDAPERYESTLRAKLATLRSELPRLHAQLRRARADNDGLRIEYMRFENADAASGARSAAAQAASAWVDAIAGDPIVVTSLGTVPVRLDDAAGAIEFLRAVALLAQQIPAQPTRAIAV
jgi:hypothetical protein